MKHFIFITNEGWTETPKGGTVENQQVLGYADGETKEEAMQSFLAENKAMLMDFDSDEIVIYEILGEKFPSDTTPTNDSPISDAEYWANDFLETHFEMSGLVENWVVLDSHLDCAESYGGKYKLAKDLTVQFQNIYQNEPWGERLEWIETLEVHFNFHIKKIKETKLL
jgi:hypothetical protein